MINKVIKDSNGNVIYEEHDDGYTEHNTYINNKLARSEIRYSNGRIEIDHYNTNSIE